MNLALAAFPTLAIRRTLTAAALAGAAAVAATPAAAAEVDFHAVAATQETLVPVVAALCPGRLAGVTLGSGSATALGAITVSAADCLTPTSATTFVFSPGRMTIVNGFGESIFIEYAGMLTAGAPSTLQGSYKVTGGTGRFWGAAGSGTLSGTLDMQTLRGRMQLDGRLRTSW